MALNEFILHRFNGDEVHRLSGATICASRTEDGIRIHLEAVSEGPAIKTLPDTAEEPSSPRASVAFVVKSLNPPELVGQQFVVPYARTRDDDLASIYYYEHEDLDDNTIQFLDRKEERFRIRWTAITQDVNFYDGSKPPAAVEIEGWFRFERLDKWMTDEAQENDINE